MRNVIGVIPARYASVRFPGKPLALIAGKPMIQHVWERCRESGVLSEIIIATEDERIVAAAEAFGATALMTSPDCRTGTDRVAEVARGRPNAHIFLNIQGDEPAMPADCIRAVAQAFDDPQTQIATLARPLEDQERANPSVVKVVMSRQGKALYFSRADIPFERDVGSGFPPRYAHLGLYGFRREVLDALARLPPSPLEEAEKLEQLRALECGFTIDCGLTLHRSIGVDRPEDIEKVERLLTR